MRTVLRYLLFGVIIVGTGKLWAFSTQGNSWPNAPGTPVHYRIQPDGAPGVTDGSDLDAVRQAFSTWESVACSYLSFTEEPWMDPPVVQADGLNRIYWVTDEAEWEVEARSTLAFTFTFYRLDDRKITDADIRANGVSWQWTTDAASVAGTTVDVETVIFHEIGHFFGLDHSQDPSAAMYASNNKGVQHDPAADDINGICTIYSNGQPIPGTEPGTGQVGAPCQAGEDCASSICADDQLVGRQYCTAECTLGAADSCGAGYQCTSTAQGGFCLAPVPVDELCDQCTNGSQCSSGICTTVPGKNFFQPFCTRACDASIGSGQCGPDYECVEIFSAGQTGGVCSPISGVCDPLGKGGQNEPCYANGGCKPGHECVEWEPGSGLFYCYGYCTAPSTPCSSTGRQVCLPVRDRPNINACFTVSRVGEPCIPEVCEDGATCAFDETVGIDTALCYQLCGPGVPNPTCPANTQCLGFEGLGNVCVPNDGFKYVGESCLSNEECESAMCRTFQNVQLCTQPCATTSPTDCPAGFKCVPGQQTVQGLCWPENFTDPDAADPTGMVSVVGGSGCSCDTSNECDRDFVDGGDCKCDPECDDGGCGCSQADPPATSSIPFAVIGLIWGIAIMGSRRRVL